jgi:hypothetical protein
MFLANLPITQSRPASSLGCSKQAHLAELSCGEPHAKSARRDSAKEAIADLTSNPQNTKNSSKTKKSPVDQLVIQKRDSGDVSLVRRGK